MSTSAGGANVNADRRIGCSPIGAAPASAAIVSHHAPAALMTTGASYVCPPAVMRHALPPRAIAVTSA